LQEPHWGSRFKVCTIRRLVLNCRQKSAANDTGTVTLYVKRGKLARTKNSERASKGRSEGDVKTKKNQRRMFLSVKMGGEWRR